MFKTNPRIKIINIIVLIKERILKALDNLYDDLNPIIPKKTPSMMMIGMDVPIKSITYSENK